MVSDIHWGYWNIYPMNKEGTTVLVYYKGYNSGISKRKILAQGKVRVQGLGDPVSFPGRPPSQYPDIFTNLEALQTSFSGVFWEIHYIDIIN